MFSGFVGDYVVSLSIEGDEIQKSVPLNKKVTFMANEIDSSSIEVEMTKVE